MGIARDSHYVPQSTLRRWSVDGKKVYAYRVLVSHCSVPEWKLRSIRGLAYQQDLYTTFAGGHEVDEFEHWVRREFEEPGLIAIERLISGRRLTPDNWRCLARFVAAQDVRTPLSFIESMKRWELQMPKILEDTLANAVKKLQAAKDQGIKLQAKREPTGFEESFRVRIEPAPGPDSDQAVIRAEVLLGRSMWVASMRHLLMGVANVLCEHRWSVMQPDNAEEWPLTDHPVLRLNYYKDRSYDFAGGWGNRGTEIMMPVSPRHLLYVQVGEKAPNRFAFSPAKTRVLQELIVERAHRWVFARQPVPWVAQAKPRLIDAARVEAERKAWQRWHEEQLGAEARKSLEGKGDNSE